MLQGKPNAQGIVIVSSQCSLPTFCNPCGQSASAMGWKWWVFEFGSKSSHHIRLCHVVTVDHYKVNRFYPQGFFLCFKRNIFTLEIEVCSHKPSSLQRAPDQTFPELFLCSILFPYLMWSSLYKWSWRNDWDSAWTLVLFLPPLTVAPCQAMLLPWSGTWNDVIRVQGHCVVRWLEAPFKWGLWSKLLSEASLFFFSSLSLRLSQGSDWGKKGNI